MDYVLSDYEFSTGESNPTQGSHKLISNFRVFLIQQGHGLLLEHRNH